MLSDVDLEAIKTNVAAATTEDLLDRITVFHYGMEPEALTLIDAELFRRGLSAADINSHAESRDNAVLSADGEPLTCCKCHRPAVVEGWERVKVWGILPLFSRMVGYCAEHRPAASR